LLELVRTRRDIGLASDLETSQASGQLETTRAALPDLQAAVRIAAHRLAVLVGANPGELLEELSRPQALPRAADLVPAGLPSELLERRPDIRQAERLLGAAHSGIRVARSQRWPKFFLTGAGGVESGSVSRFLNAASRTWIWSPEFTLPIFQLRGIRAQIRAAEARNDQALATYHQTVLLALEDVENALVRYGQAQRKEEMLEAAVADNERAVELSQTLYQEGLSDFLTVLDAERRLFEAQAQWVASETAVLTSLTGLYKSLGGGW
jgi:multidrug efflux system outer membrane protein